MAVMTRSAFILAWLDSTRMASDGDFILGCCALRRLQCMGTPRGLALIVWVFTGPLALWVLSKTCNELIALPGIFRDAYLLALRGVVVAIVVHYCCGRWGCCTRGSHCELIACRRMDGLRVELNTYVGSFFCR